MFFTIIILYSLYLTGWAHIDNNIQKTKSEDKLLDTLYEKGKQVKQSMKEVTSRITPDDNSLLEQRIRKEIKISENPFGITLYKPTYVLPFYYTGSPAYAVYAGNTPGSQGIKKAEFKGQLSLQLPVWENIFDTENSLHVAYTQQSYWQVYVESQFFRETVYTPEIFVVNHAFKNWQFQVGAVHQSNGRGADFERSWNRLYADVRFSGNQWLVSIKPWVLIFKGVSSELHNPDITKFLGNERILLAVKVRDLVLSASFRNTIESSFRRSTEEISISFPILQHVRGYVQIFRGYGQSLIEYNHFTKSIGVGIALNDWI